MGARRHVQVGARAPPWILTDSSNNSSSSKQQQQQQQQQHNTLLVLINFTRKRTITKSKDERF